METQIWCLPVGFVRGGLIKGTVSSASTSIWEKAVPPALALMLGNSVSPSVFLVPFRLLPQHWNSEGVSLSKSVCRPFKKNCLGCQKPSLSLSLNPCWFLQPELMGTSLPGTGTLVWGPCVELGPLAPDFYLPCVGVDLACYCPYLSYQSRCGFFNSLVVGLPFSQILGGSE